MGPSAKRDVAKDDADSDFAATVASMPPMLDSAPPSEPPADDDATVPADLAGAPTISHIGRYALKHTLGEGGLGTVYEAWDPLLSRTVAVKTLQFDLAPAQRSALDRLFLNEARAVAGLNHPHIVTIHDAGLSAHGVYIAMERLVGRDLRQALASGWRPSPPQAAQLVRRVADALAYAHARGVVHCDIKPANIFLTRKDRPTVLDFGIARVAHGAQGSAAQALEGLVAGSPHYLAPEQLDGGAIDGRTDVYALGVVLYELLAGRKAFEGDSLEQILNAVRHAHPAPANEVQSSVPPGLAGVAMQAMARNPEQRHASAAALAQALRPWQHRSAHEDSVPPVPVGRPASVRPPHRRASWLAWAGTAVVVMGAGVAAWTWQAPPPAAAALASAPPSAPAPAPASGPPAIAATTPGSTDTLPDATGAATTEPPPAAAEPVTALAALPAAKPVARPVPPRRTVPLVPAPAVAPAMGVLQVAVTPWGEVEVDGRPAGITPPLVKLELSEGTHQITIRNGDFPPYTAQVEVHPDQPTVVRHRFGS